ncbi:MAG: IclR family transcriptional regulator [Thermodesulfobacteriota bacterium]
MVGTDQYFSKTLHKGLKVLSLFNEQKTVYTQTEIARTLDLNMTSTYRLTNTLVQLGYLTKDKESKRLRLGLGALALGATLVRTFDTHRMIRSLVDTVHEKHNISIDLVLVMGDLMTSVYRREAEETLVYRLPSVSRAWHTTSLGKAYLAFLPEEEAERDIRKLTLEARTPNSITSRRGLREELARTRARGYAIANEEFLRGLLAIGAPIISPETGKPIGAVSFDFSTLQQTVETMTRDYAGLLLELSRDLAKVITAK